MSVTLIDARGPRFGAVITSIVLAAVLLTLQVNVAVAIGLLALQTTVFALGALIGLHAQPYGIIFKRFVRPLIGATSELEDVRPPRFAQAVGLGFALVGLISLILGAQTVALIAVAAALSAAFLNAAFNYCLGCELYVLIARVRGRASAEQVANQ